MSVSTVVLSKYGTLQALVRIQDFRGHGESVSCILEPFTIH